MDICTDLLKALKGEHLSSVFSPDGTLISASAAPHCGAVTGSFTQPEKSWMLAKIPKNVARAALLRCTLAEHGSYGSRLGSKLHTETTPTDRGDGDERPSERECERVS